jgi:hypothetical protein
VPILQVSLHAEPLPIGHVAHIEGSGGSFGLDCCLLDHAYINSGGSLRASHDVVEVVVNLNRSGRLSLNIRSHFPQSPSRKRLPLHLSIARPLAAGHATYGTTMI